MNKKSTKIVVEFKDMPDSLYKQFGNVEKNRIILDIQLGKIALSRSRPDLRFYILLSGISAKRKKETSTDQTCLRRLEGSMYKIRQVWLITQG